MSTLDRPIFIVGTGRCGSTVLHEMLAKHSQVSYLSYLLARHPSRTSWNRWAMENRDRSYLPGPLRRRLLPSEAWQFWDHCIPGFSEPCRDMEGDDLGARAESRALRALEQAMASTRPRLLVKFTGWTRIGFIKKAFPDARIVHVLREAPPVVNSMLNVDWWSGWHGPEQWRWGNLSEDEMETWLRYGRSFEVLGAVEWIRILRAYRRSLELLSQDHQADVMEIHYNDLCGDRDGQLKSLLAFCGLEDQPEFWRAVSAFQLRSMDDKWRRDLNPVQQERLEHALHDLDAQALLHGLSRQSRLGANKT